MSGGSTSNGRQPPYRMLYFVRHGHYDNQPSAPTGGLTALGRRQATKLGRYFERYPIDSIVSSNLPRAVETADILASKLGIHRVRHRRVLREVLPVRVAGMRVPLLKRADSKRRLESIITEFFKVSRSTRHEVIVCHGNLIRTLVCRLTGAPITSFVKMRTHHTGITCFVVDNAGVKLVAYNVVEHLPLAMQSQM